MLNYFSHYEVPILKNMHSQKANCRLNYFPWPAKHLIVDYH